MSAKTNSRHLYWRACCHRAVWQRAAKLGFVAGLIQIGLNQGDHWIRHEINASVIIKTILCPLLSFSIAFASSAATYVENLQRTPSSS